MDPVTLQRLAHIRQQEMLDQAEWIRQHPIQPVILPFLGRALAWTGHLLLRLSQPRRAHNTAASSGTYARLPR